MDRPRFQFGIAPIMTFVAVVAVAIATWPHGALLIDVIILWTAYEAASRRRRDRWRHEGRVPTRRERAADERASCLFAIAFWVGLALILSGVRLIVRAVR